MNVIPPSIDAFTPKNQPLPPGSIEAILRACGAHDGPTDGGAAYSRLDGSPGGSSARWSGTARRGCPRRRPRWCRCRAGTGSRTRRACSARSYEGIAPSDAHLVLAGPSTAAVADDPEGPPSSPRSPLRRMACLRSCARVHLFSLPMEDLQENAIIVNALQRRADVIVQKSLAEGFGLTVAAEGMWKARPVVASAVGGVQDQIVDGESGLLVDPDDLDGFARAVRERLADPARAEWMGHNARERVRGAFLGAHHLEQYVDLFGESSVSAASANCGGSRGSTDGG